ncbi:MAG: hypothetical protein E7370_01260 [Clostridiales bacterium]|nr:hypothetical protein [Clostridiales bacterium]
MKTSNRATRARTRAKATKTKPLTAETKARKAAINFAFFSKDDPNGSYTGVPQNVNDTPVQDVDDL